MNWLLVIIGALNTVSAALLSPRQPDTVHLLNLWAIPFQLTFIAWLGGRYFQLPEQTRAKSVEVWAGATFYAVTEVVLSALLIKTDIGIDRWSATDWRHAGMTALAVFGTGVFFGMAVATWRQRKAA